MENFLTQLITDKYFGIYLLISFWGIYWAIQFYLGLGDDAWGDYVEFSHEEKNYGEADMQKIFEKLALIQWFMIINMIVLTTILYKVW